jgi:S-adenosylmethionine/arginine decarboxylase-like enzyme
MWGRHLIVNARSCNKLLIGLQSHIHRFSDDMVKQIDMTAYGKPLIVHFGSGNKSGYSLVQLITTSSITGHFCDESGDAYLDIFSCKHFSEQTAADVIQKWFEPSHIDMKLIERDANHKMS